MNWNKEGHTDVDEISRLMTRHEMYKTEWQRETKTDKYKLI